MSENSTTPLWIKPDLFTDVLNKTVGAYKKIKTFKVYNALKPGENYATVMLKVQIQLILNDDSHQDQTYMLKVPLNNDVHREYLCHWNMFVKEAGMYSEVLPEMQKLYRDKGMELQFGPQSYKLPINEEYVLLEDLNKKGFRNAKRQDGLDMLHCQSVLKKLAHWHAASAVRIAENGLYPEIYQHGYLAPTENASNVCKNLFSNCFKYATKSARKLPDNLRYIERIESIYCHILDIIYEHCKPNPKEFNVLNHGDCWVNNIMFQYNDRGELRDTVFIDLQMPRYGSPAQDLWYFMMSSPKLTIKINHFDDLILYYYNNLINCLKTLEYNKALPTMEDLESILQRQGVWSLFTICTSMGSVLCDASDSASIDGIMDEEGGENSFVQNMYFNERYTDHIAQLLPWLYDKGVLNYSC